MALKSGNRSAEALLRDAIEDVLRATSRWLWTVLGLGLVGVVVSYLTVLNRMYLLRYVTVTYDWDSVLSVCILAAALTVLAVAFTYLRGIAVSSISTYAARRLAVPAVLATAQRAGRPETLAGEALHDIETMRTSLAGPVSHAVVDITLAPLIVALSFIMHVAYGILALFYCIGAAILSVLIAQAASSAVRLRGSSQARAFGLAADAMRSGEAVLAMGMLPRLATHWVGVSTEASGEAWLAERRAARLKTALEILLGSLRGAIILLGAVLALYGEATMIAMVGSLFLMAKLTSPFISIGSSAHEIAEGLAAWRRLRALVHGSPMPPAGIAFPCPEGQLLIEQMSFAFRGSQRALLRNIQLQVRRGEILAIVGPSGSGKSTLLRLIVGMYPPSSGGIYLDGHATHQWNRHDLARHVGFLPQEPLLSRGTVAEIIARLETPNMGLVLDAAKRAGAHETIVGLPLGYATPVTGGPQLSMGQRQRIALARALYGRPKLLVLDELAGSMDAEGEAQVARLLSALREEGTSVIFTTHRPRLLMVADRIMALRDGSLVPTGKETSRLPGQGIPPGRKLSLAGPAA
ncbi:MAG: ATP-binding cassette domain-containing protein [Acetobacteraceae bacterium]|nr:ATP-binding cassette domain-containing protein [Acetobacteraceae bacterium]